MIKLNFLTPKQTTKILNIFKRPYLYVFITVIIAYLAINIYFNELYVVGLKILRYNPAVSIPYITFNIINTFFIGVSMTLGFVRFVELGIINAKASIISVIGSTFALLTGACPGCISGLLPVVAGMFGSTLNLNSFPFHGIEIQALSTLLLLFGINQLTKDVACKINN
ncbi:hypothetical protein KBD45_02135 [Candidatus Dojkabacteria bacterium]|nr:hypothetical protein [Candidatus Dojkabacteria bacterium]